ncbi:carbohydrate kinase family protein [Candidatus Woesearchaeota archaeon]|nr:carbohydrate kinase family protein [Candidatus Woesearchaeota archaeon]
MQKYQVLCIGSATVDHFLTIEQPFSSVHVGDKIKTLELATFSGGGATNAGAALTKLGIKTKILTKLGNDHAANIVEKELRAFGVQNVCKTRSRKNTDSSTVLSFAQEKDRIIFAHKGASQELTSSDWKNAPKQMEWIYLASLTGHAFFLTQKIVSFAKKHKVKLLLNPSLYLTQTGKKHLDLLLQATTLLVLNKEEAQAIAGKKAVSAVLLKLLQKQGPETVVITDGPRTLYALHEGKQYSLIPPDVKIKDTTGAGDAFTAGLLAGIIKKCSFADALRMGQVNALGVLQHFGAKYKLLTEKEGKEGMKKYKIKVVVRRG